MPNRHMWNEMTLKRPRPRRRRAPLQPVRLEDRQVVLRDGRRLGYAEYGDPVGRPVFFFHGFGTTRVICPPDIEPALSLGLRLIAVDRPGVGLSEPKPRRSLLDWPLDVVQLADQLAIDRFAVVGWSGGGPYAAACGYLLPERVTSVGLVSAPAPLSGVAERDYLRRFERNAARAAGRAPWMVRLAMWHWGRPQRRNAERFFDESVADMVAADRHVLARPEVRGLMIANSAELYRHGGRGMYDEALVLARPWGFDLGDLGVPVYIWHGELDQSVPLGMPLYLARSIPDSRVTILPGHGHHVLYSHWPEILAAFA